MKGKFKVFLRTTAISSVVLLSVVVGSIGVCKAYENIRLVGFGEYKNAIENPVAFLWSGLFLPHCKMERKGHRMNQSSPQGLPEGVHWYAERLDWFIAKGI